MGVQTFVLHYLNCLKSKHWVQHCLYWKKNRLHSVEQKAKLDEPKHAQLLTHPDPLQCDNETDDLFNKTDEISRREHYLIFKLQINPFF